VVHQSTGVNGQTAVEQHRVITLYQDRDVLIGGLQESGLSSFARVDSHYSTRSFRRWQAV